MAVFTWGYTGSMRDQLDDYYDWVPFDGALDLEAGEILLRETEGGGLCAHTCICSEPGWVLEASDDFDDMPGDSSGWEVCEREIHQNGWEWVGIPKRDKLNIAAGIAWGREYVEDDSHGYSQGPDRMVPEEGGTDCSALVLLIVGVMIESVDPNYVPPTPAEAREQANNNERAEWQGDMIGKSDTTNCGDDYAGVLGKPVRYIAIEGVGKYQTHDKGKPADDWWPCVDKYDLDDEENGMAGSNAPTDGLRIFDPTVSYQVHGIGKPLDEWHEVMHGTTDTSKVGDDYAGEYGEAFDLVRIWREGGDQPRYNVYS